MNSDSLKKPVSATKLKEKRDEEEAVEHGYPDDVEDDSEEEVNNFHKTDQVHVNVLYRKPLVRLGFTRIFCISHYSYFLYFFTQGSR